jgi:heptaprenylglyceryl phosphate synthase
MLPAFQDCVSLRLQKIWINNIYVEGSSDKVTKKCDVVDFLVLVNCQNCEFLMDSNFELGSK